MRFLLILLLLSLPSFALAQETGQVATVVKGAPAPFSGTLFDPTAVASILAAREIAKKQCELDSALVSAKQQAKCDLESANLKLERDILSKKYDTVVALKDKELDRVYEAVAKSEKSNSYKWLWFVGGVVVGGGIAVGLAFGLNGSR